MIKKYFIGFLLIILISPTIFSQNISNNTSNNNNENLNNEKLETIKKYENTFETMYLISIGLIIMLSLIALVMVWQNFGTKILIESLVILAIATGIGLAIIFL